jgi:hypothetical protein
MVPSRLLSIATLSALLGASVGCAPGNPGMDILGSAPPDPGNMCVLDPSTNIFEGGYTFDLDPRFAPTFALGLVVQNHLINRFSTTFPVMANQSDIIISGAEVELVDRNGRRLAITNSFYRTLASGSIPAASGDQPGRGIASTEIIPPNVAAQLPSIFLDAPAGGASIVARVAIIGTTQGGTEVISSDFIVPVRLCVDCLFLPGAPPEGEENGCRPSQDPFFVGGFTPLTPCETGDTCPSDLCVLGRCLP